MPVCRQNARFDPKGRLSPRVAQSHACPWATNTFPAPVLQLGHRIGIAVDPYRNSTPPSPASIDRRHTAFDPVDQSAAGWGTGRRRVESAGHVPDTSFPGSVRKQTPNYPVRSAAPSSSYLSPPWLQAPSPPTRRRLVTHDPIPTGLPGRWNGSCGRKRKRAHAHVCMQMCAHMLACNHTHTPLCALCLRRRF